MRQRYTYLLGVLTLVVASAKMVVAQGQFTPAQVPDDMIVHILSAAMGNPQLRKELQIVDDQMAELRDTVRGFHEPMQKRQTEQRETMASTLSKQQELHTSNPTTQNSH